MVGPRLVGILGYTEIACDFMRGETVVALAELSWQWPRQWQWRLGRGKGNSTGKSGAGCVVVGGAAAGVDEKERKSGWANGSWNEPTGNSSSDGTGKDTRACRGTETHERHA